MKAFKIDNEVIAASSLDEAKTLSATYHPRTSLCEVVGETFLDAHVQEEPVETLRSLLALAKKPGVIWTFEPRVNDYCPTTRT